MYLIQSYHLYQFKKNGSGLWFFSICQKMMFTKVVVKCHYHLSCLTMIGPLQLAIHVVQNHHTGEQKSRWVDKQRKLPFKIMYVFCLSCPSATFALQRGGFAPREWLDAKGLLLCFGSEAYNKLFIGWMWFFFYHTPD